MDGILGKKVGMTQIFAADGDAIPVTVVQAGPCLVVQRKTKDKDGYEAVQVGLVEDRPARHVTKPHAGHFKKAGVTPMRKLDGVLASTTARSSRPATRSRPRCSPRRTTSTSSAPARARASRAWSSATTSAAAARATARCSIAPRARSATRRSRRACIPGMRGTGRMGGKRITVKNLQVVKVDDEQNLIYLRGAIPGPANGYVAIRRAKRG